MPPFIEVEGKNIEKAVDKACAKLKIPRHTLEYEVISYGSTGIFGLAGVKKARIRVTIPETFSDRNSAFAEPENHSDRDLDSKATALLRDTLDKTQLHTFPDDPLELGKNVLQRIVDAITSDAEIRVEDAPDRLLFNVVGGNKAVLIGKHGQTLEAIQSIVEKIINTRNQHRIRVEVDIGGYIENRRTNLQRQAARLAEKCKRIGKPVAVGQMNAHDRRIVHLALKNDKAVRTQSIGDGYLRKLMIFPKKNSGNRRERQPNNG
ncbi:MAG: RNA-binding cell elongation regulator Jag/EloR [Desulfobacterales bacterium]